MRTEAEVADIKRRWKLRLYINESRHLYQAYSEEWERAYFDEISGGYNVYHRKHQFATKIAQGATLSGGEAEKKVGRLLAMNGKRVEFQAEGTEYKKKCADLRFDGKEWDVKYIELSNESTIRTYIEDARKADCVIFYAGGNDRYDSIASALSRERGKYKSSPDKLRELPQVYVIRDNGTLTLIE